MAEYIERDLFLDSKRHLYCENCARRKNEKGKIVYEIGDAPCRSCGVGDVLDDVEDFPAADAIEELLKAAKAMHTWIFLNSGDEQAAYDECGLSDEMNVALGYGGQFVVETPREESKPRWIPVTERLPMRGEKAICFGKNGYMIGTYGEFGWMFPCYFGGVTHWMPLPQPPKEET